MSRMKFILQAKGNNPGEVVVEGTPYFPEDDGEGRFVIQVVNEAHKETLVKHHAFSIVGTAEVTAPRPLLGPILFDELGRTDLLAELAKRGVETPAGAEREQLDDAARKWNERRRRGETDAKAPVSSLRPLTVSMVRGFSPSLTDAEVERIADQVLAAVERGQDPETALRAALEEPRTAAAPGAPLKATDTGEPRRVSEDDIKALSYKELVGLAAQHGVAVAPGALKMNVQKAVIKAIARSPVAA